MSNFEPIDGMIAKLPDGSLIDTNELEQQVLKICHYVKHVAFYLKDGKSPVAVIFPNRSLFTNPDYVKSPEEGCFCPRNLPEIGKCLTGCMHSLNDKLPATSSKLDAAVIINTELSVTDGTLNPAGNVMPKNILKKYKNHLENLYGAQLLVNEEAFEMRLCND